MKKKVSKKELPIHDHQLTWDMIFEDFKKHHPKLVEKVTLWFAYDIGEIEIHLTDGIKLVYSYDEHRAMIISDGE